jgi:hypothetical protein
VSELNCPKCGANVGTIIGGNLVRYQCGTLTECGDVSGQADKCRIAELEAANARLTSELAATRKLLAKVTVNADKWKRLIGVFEELPGDTEIVLRRRDIAKEAERLVAEAVAAAEKAMGET